MATSSSQKKASRAHRKRIAARGLVRVEVQATQSDIRLIRALAETLRKEPRRAKALRSALERALVDPRLQTAFDVFASELPDEAFDGIFEQAREKAWRKVEL